MGLLKHVTLPMLSLAHGFAVFGLVKGIIDDFPPSEKGEAERSPMEKHLIFVFAGIMVAFLIMDLLGIFVENAHFRGLVVALNLVVVGFDCYDWATRDGFGMNAPLVILELFLLVSLIVHWQEPGLFTQDKNTKQA